MYALFRLHNWKPSDYYNMGHGEKIIVSAFLREEVKEIEKEYGGK